MATWSDSRAVADYQKFLESGKSEPDRLPDGASVILQPVEGPRELTDALARMGMGDDLVLTPNQDPPATLQGRTEYPIYVTLPPNQIKPFLANLPESYKARNEDLCFISGGLQYGNIEDDLKEYGYCRDSMTQVLITGLKAYPNGCIEDLSVNIGLDANGADKWAGECASCGKWMDAIAERLERSAVRCVTGPYRDWRRRMWERTLYDGIFNLLGVVRSKPTTIADVSMYYYEEVADLVWEASGLLRGWKALTLTYGFEERLLEVADATGKEEPCQVTEEMFPWIWGNPVFLEGKSFVEYLRLAQEDKGLLSSIVLPERRSDGPQIMRQGNLRADGVI